MKNVLYYKYFNFLLKDVYNRTIKHYGFTPSGVCWVNQKSQYKRFNVITSLIKRLSNQKALKIADIGCGYGELFNYFLKNEILCSYEGYDINKQMINYCRKEYPQIKFYNQSFPSNLCDISVMSGTYNYAVTDDINLWEKYIMFNVSKCLRNSKLGVVFNLQFQKKREIRNNIYYTDVSQMYGLLESEFTNIEKFYSIYSPKDIYFIIKK